MVYTALRSLRAPRTELALRVEVRSPYTQTPESGSYSMLLFVRVGSVISGI